MAIRRNSRYPDASPVKICTLTPVHGDLDDPESEDFMIGRITLHQKTIWMLRSFLK